MAFFQLLDIMGLECLKFLPALCCTKGQDRVLCQIIFIQVAHKKLPMRAANVDAQIAKWQLHYLHIDPGTKIHT